MPKKKTKEAKVEEIKLTKAGKPRKKPGRPKSKKRYYFGDEQQDAIIEYNTNPDNFALRNKLYSKIIHPCFDKLAENIINTFKFTYFDYGFMDVKHETLAFLVMNIHKYDHTKGSKAFSYFSVVAKNYLILANNANYKKLKSHGDLSLLDRKPTNENGDDDLFEFTNQLVKYFEKNILNIFKKKRDVDIAYAIVELIKRREEIENFNKKSLYLLIREITGVKTSKITKIVNELKRHYKMAYAEYSKRGFVKSKKKNKFF